MTRSGRRFARKTGWPASTVRLEATPVPLWSGGRRRARVLERRARTGAGTYARVASARRLGARLAVPGRSTGRGLQGHPAPAPGQQPGSRQGRRDLYCPAMPEALVMASFDARAGALDEPTYQARLVAMADWRLAQRRAGTRPLRAPGLPGPGT
jgi:hypothetical protein